MTPAHENYKELVLRLAKTDFQLRYHGSVLGYIWAVLKPLLLFLVLNFVFSSVFNFKNIGIPYYTLELLTGLLLFNFFAEGTSSGISSLLTKSQLVTKIFVPRWTIVIASTINALFVFGMNMAIMIGFFVYYGKYPSVESIIIFGFYVLLLYFLIVSIALLLAPLFARFRDVGMIWEVIVSILMYASPIIYPLTLLPVHLQKIALFNPLAFIIHFAKQGVVSNHFADFGHILIMTTSIALSLGLSIFIFRKSSKRVAEYL
jgi:ABC-2 type transport system permease protein